jgi:hypothetical protein
MRDRRETRGKSGRQDKENRWDVKIEKNKRRETGDRRGRDTGDRRGTRDGR